VSTIRELLQRRAADERPGLVFEDSVWSWSELVTACAERAQIMEALRQPGPWHVGVLLDNIPEFTMWLGGASLCGAVIVGINPTRRGTELARDISHAECQLVVTEPAYRPLLEGISLALEPERILDVESGSYAAEVSAHRGAPVPEAGVTESSLFLLLFTSGTSGAPKACICSQGRLARIGEIVAENFGLSPADNCYLAMPMFHSNALMAGWAPALAAGATIVQRRRFSASGFLPDVRRYGVTFFNYVGKPLSYILATPERPDDADNPLTRVFGNEAADHDIERFAERFGCAVIDGYGSTEGGASVSRTPDSPPGSIGRAPEGTVVLDPETGQECPRARFGEDGRLLNAEEAIGEIASRMGATTFEGYWKNDEANRARVHDGYYWSGDLAYRDSDGFFYFAGRNIDWLRVDGENFAAAPVERILSRHSDVLLAAVYAVPDPEVGDQVMAALQMAPGSRFDPEGFARFLDDQPDLGTKWAPRFVRPMSSLPSTRTNKILKRVLQAQRWECPEPVWWRPEGRGPYRVLGAEDLDGLRRRVEARDRAGVLGGAEPDGGPDRERS
jgi:fatty-acyl-CoA synthase